MRDENGAKVPEAVIAVPQPTSVQLKQALVHRIAVGMYPPGSKLPSVRELAESLGVNRNTVSKVYQELAREQVVRTVPGKGVFVVTTDVRQAQGNSIQKQIARAVEAASRKARLYGLSRKKVVELFLQAVDQVYERQAVQLAFVECNLHDTEEMARDLESFLQMEVQPLVLTDLKSQATSWAQQFDLICTTFYHLTELSQLLPDHQDKVVALQVTPRPEVLLSISRYDKSHRVALIVNNQRTLDSVLRIIESYSEADVETVLTSDERAVLELVERSDAIVDTLGSHELVARLAPDKPTITVTYHADGQSLEYLRHRMLQCLEGKGGCHAGSQGDG